MTVARACSVALVGLEPLLVTVEAHVGPGLPALHLIGSSGAAGREAADRVRTALAAVGVTLPQRKALVSLAPADVPKAGARFDLAMAAALLAAVGVVDQEALDGVALLGELALDGAVRPVPGVLPGAAFVAREARRLVVPDANGAEARLGAPRLDVVAVAGLGELLAVLRGEQPPRRPPPALPARIPSPTEDLADVRGQLEARRALEIAAAGGHHLLLVGPPGSGKSMLARRLPSILPPLTHDEALELAAIRSVAGSAHGLLDLAPPFRAPHHSVSAAALLGGGTGVARPGELSLAHRGVLFLDELFEWPRALLESLREPLEEGVVRVSRSKATVVYPARVLLVCAANPCPCGGGDTCGCADDTIWAYRSRLSGPLADRIDLAPAIAPLSAADLVDEAPGESSAAVAVRVARARAAAADRWSPAHLTNAAVPSALLRRVARPQALHRLAAAVAAGLLTGRGFDRALRVARTIADLAGDDLVDDDHVMEAVGHRLQLGARRNRVRAAAP